MAWYKSAKTRLCLSMIRKHAMPTAAVECADCKSHLLVDVKQRISNMGSDPGFEAGKCITMCDKCHNSLLIDYGLQVMDYCEANARHINESEASELISNGIPVVYSFDPEDDGLWNFVHEYPLTHSSPIQ